MDFSVKSWLLFTATMLVLVGPSPSAATIFTVGDNVGWTTLNTPNYTAWASGKTFRVGDTLVFKYHNQIHNVLVVKKAEFNECKNTSVIKEYNSGDDSIVIETTGHHYFICGFPGHCQVGQKLNILAVGSSAAPSSSPSGSPPPVNAGDRLVVKVSVFVGGLIMTALCATVLLGF